MLQVESMNLVVNGILVLSMTVSGIYLAIRAIKLKSAALAFLSLGFLSFLSTIIINELVPPSNVLARSIAAANYAILIILFTKHAFYKGRKSPFKIVLLVTVVIRILHFIEMNLLGHVAPSNVPIPVEKLGEYYFHLIMLSSQLVISFGWLSIAAFRAFLASKNETVEPWVRSRYAIVGISNALYAILSFAFFLVPTDGLTFASPDAIAANIIIPPIVVSYGALSLLSWVMPGWFRQILNAGQPLTKYSENREMFTNVPTEIQDRVITMPELMKVIDYLGDKLATMIRKAPSAAKGLWLMAIDKELGEFGLYTIRLPNLLKVTNNSLKTFLKDMGIDGAEAIVAKLAGEIIKNQSVFLMMAV
jgi:hypothetical protein